MIQFISFIVVYTITVFIFSFVFINKRHDKINQSFLLFLGNIMIWMILNASSIYLDNDLFDQILKAIYFISLMNIAVFFLYFVYQLLQRKVDWLFYMIVVINTVTICVRLLLPIDYTRANFWHLADPVIGPMMAAIFCLPMVVAIYLIIKVYRSTQHQSLKMQLRFLLIGICSATIVSFISENLMPQISRFSAESSLMYQALFVLNLFLYYAIIRHKFLNIPAEYIYQKMFLNSGEGMLLIDKDGTILSCNEAAKIIFDDCNMDDRSKITEYIEDYHFGENYNRDEIQVSVGDSIRYLLIAQSPTDGRDSMSAKLVQLTDVTFKKQLLIKENAELKERAYIDQLTGLYNRTYINDRFASETEVLLKKSTVLFIDIDHFKFINDTYGHRIGDKVLQAVGHSIKCSLRNNEIAIRYGGDEFIIILNETTNADAYKIAERIQNKVKTISITEFDRKQEITLSIGLSEGIGDVNVVINQADKAMYDSKKQGKDRINFYLKNKLRQE